MIKKLRRKFVIINMSLVAVILCVVLGMFCFTRIHAFQAESEMAMRQMLDDSHSKEPPENDTKPQPPSLDFGPGGRNPAFNSVPVFLITLDENNEITDTSSSGSYTVTDTLSEAAVSAALDVSEDQGYLSDLKLRFIKQNTPEGMKIAFADTVQETRALGELVVQCIMMLLLFLLCFLVVSIFLARSDAKSTPMVYSTFSFSDLILGCLLTFEPVAFEQGVMIEDEISDDIFISGDAPQIRQLVAILLDNACKYAGIADDCDKSGNSEKKVTVTLTSENEKIKLTVHNTGKAIPEEDLPHLFERFYRTDKSRARTDGGYGLGLAIAQTIAKNHRGKITVVSAKNLGTSFTVTLPVAKEKEHA